MWWWDDGMQYDYQVDSSGDITGENSHYEDNNTDSTWYQAVSPIGILLFLHCLTFSAGSACWTQPLVYNGASMITFSHATFEGSEFVGVNGVDLFLSYAAGILQVTKQLYQKLPTPENQSGIWDCVLDR